MFQIQRANSDTRSKDIVTNAPRTTLKMRTVHLIDDSVEDAHFVQRVLNIVYPACHITHFKSGISNLESSMRKPDLSLIDVNMPGISGLETYHALIQSDELVPTYFIIGQAHSIAQQQLFSVGVRGLLIKEFGVMQTACLWKYHLSLDKVFNS